MDQSDRTMNVTAATPEVTPTHPAMKKRKAEKRSKAKPPKKAAPRRAKKAVGARNGSKKAKILAMLKRPTGASLEQLMKATDWQAHSVRGFLSGELRRKMGLHVHTEKQEGGVRTYSIRA